VYSSITGAHFQRLRILSSLVSPFGVLRSIQESELELVLSWCNQLSVRKNMFQTHEIPIKEHVSWWELAS